MNRILLCLAFISCTFAAASQKLYFIYVQSDPAQPFYVKLDEKVFSSTASGYLILSRLKDSSYSFSIGFPANKWPEQRFSVTMERKDHGYLLKNFADKGWGLFDLQTMAVIMASQSDSKKDGARNTENKEASDFTNILSKAADDPSLKEKPVPVKAEPKTIAEAQPPVKAPVVTQTEPASKPEKEPQPGSLTAVTEKAPVVTKPEDISKPVPDPFLKEKPVQAKPEEPKPEPVVLVPDKTVPVVTKTETALKEEPGKEETVVPKKEDSKQDPPKDPVVVKTTPADAPREQEVKGKDEPVAVTQPAETEQVTAYKPSVVKRRSESSTTEGFGLTFTDSYSDGVDDTIRILIPNPKPVVVPVKEEPKEERKFLETTPTDTTQEVKEEPAKPEEKPAANAALKNNCPSVADDNDFLRIRKKMAAATSDDDMVLEAKKIFRTKCYSTTQIKNLGSLFLSDEGKYKFFDAAYAYAADPANFPALESELKDAYYINRFKAMLRL